VICTITHRCRSKQMCRGVKDFCPNFLQLNCPKKFCALLPTNFLRQRSWRACLGMTSKKRSSCVFLQTLGANFWSQTTLWAPFLPGFSGILPRYSGILPGLSKICSYFQRFCPNFQGFSPNFRQIKTLGVCLRSLHLHLLHH